MKTNYKILVSDPLGNGGLEVFKKEPQIEVDLRPGLSPNELKKIVAGYDAIIVRSGTHLTKDIIQEAKRRGCKVYNFWGIVRDNQTHHPWYGLSQFKKGFGGAVESYVKAQDFVLSPRYWLTYGIETLRRIGRRL